MRHEHQAVGLVGPAGRCLTCSRELFTCGRQVLLSFTNGRRGRLQVRSEPHAHGVGERLPLILAGATGRLAVRDVGRG